MSERRQGRPQQAREGQKRRKRPAAVSEKAARLGPAKRVRLVGGAANQIEGVTDQVGPTLPTVKNPAAAPAVTKVTAATKATQRDSSGSGGGISATELGRMFGVTKQAVGLWHKRNECPRNADGTYDLAAVSRWLYRMWAEARADPVASDYPVMQQKYRALQVKADYEKAVGKLVETDRIAAFLQNVVLTARTMLQAIPQSLAPQCVGLEAPGIKELIENGLRRVCDDLAAACGGFLADESSGAKTGT